MKKILPLLLVLCLLSGCSNASIAKIGGADAPEETETAAVTIEAPDEEAVRNAFEKAKEVYGWFDLCSMDTDFSDKYTVGDWEYHRVVNDEVPTYDALRTLVYNLFDTATGDRLLDEDNEHPPYIDVDGVLYGLDGARGSDITKGDATMTVEYLNSTTIVCHVEVELIDFDEDAEDYVKVVGSEQHDYHYQLVGNRWVFTDFSLYY